MVLQKILYSEPAVIGDGTSSSTLVTPTKMVRNRKKIHHEMKIRKKRSNSVKKTRLEYEAEYESESVFIYYYSKK